MNISSILSPECVLFNQDCTSKKRILEAIASHFGKQYRALNPDTVFNALIARERLGSTAIGQGIAIPHCRISDCNTTLGLLVTLDKAVDFDAIDNQPVDIIFVLLVPEDNDQNHLQTLATLAEAFSQTEIQRQLRQADSPEELYTVMTD
ncbi:MAG: PTS system nitrogen regulatory IIA component [Cellvibrionaceae bacterium]|jgi:PTS system nitrogen regulatory IIA component